MDSNSYPVPKNLLPDVLDFTIYDGCHNIYSIRWLPDLQVLELGEVPDAKHVQVSAAQWRIFWVTLNYLKLWHWHKLYAHDFPICDGTMWNLKIKYRAEQIESSGDNAYPGTNDIDFTADCDFGIFLAAVDVLAGTDFSNDSDE